MATKRIRTGTVYRYDPVWLDQFDGRTTLQPGDKVQAIKSPPGCPAAGTMGHCYVGEAENGHFIGLVCCNSLVSETEWQKRQRAAAK